jgi:hypothetical protein
MKATMSVVVGGLLKHTSRGAKKGEGVTIEFRGRQFDVPAGIVEKIDGVTKNAERLQKYLESTPNSPGPHTLQTALIVAIDNKAVKDVQMLLDAGASATFNQQEPLVHAVNNFRDPAVMITAVLHKCVTCSSLIKNIGTGSICGRLSNPYVTCVVCV